MLLHRFRNYSNIILYFFILYLSGNPNSALASRNSMAALVFGREGEQNRDSADDHENCNKKSGFHDPS